MHQWANDFSSLYLGVDIGTSGCRGLAINLDGEVLAEARVELPVPEHRDHGGVLQQPERWWQALLEVLRDLGRQVPPARASALALDGTSASLLCTDAEGRPLGPALMYNDTSARAEAARVAEIAPPQSAVHGASASLAKLLYLQARHPGARHALHQAEWLANRLCGRYGFGDENNCLKLGYDPVTRAWPNWLSPLGIRRELLPEVQPPGNLLGLLRPDLAAELGLPPTLRILAGTTDSTASFLATGARQPGEAVTALGSTLVLKILSERPIFKPEYGVYSHRLGDRWLVGGASNSGGAVLLHYFTKSQLQNMTPDLRPEQPTGLDYYPLVRPGERFPFNDPEFPPRLSPRPGEDVRFFQAMLEGMARIEQQGYGLLRELGAPSPVSVRTTGGGAANPAWQRLRGKLLRVPLLPARHGEAAYGAALLARDGCRV